MKTIGIICEYNPFHMGHQKQFYRIREEFGPNCAIVCAMSGNFVQRGMPAIVDKSHRAKAAVLSGADLVLELPVTVALSSAEGFASGGVSILSQLCDVLCFGAETPDPQALQATVLALQSEDFPVLLRQHLDSGKSFPAARQAALESMGLDGHLLTKPNDILAVEYCKAIRTQNASMVPFPIQRHGSYHAEIADSENPSATAVRNLMLHSYNWKTCVPKAAREVFLGAPLHSISYGERAILARLRTMSEPEFEALPYGAEGLWRKLMHESRRQPTLEDILGAVKSKRYTRSRLDRMVMCAFLGITKDMLASPIPYVRILAFNDRGRAVLKKTKKSGLFLNAGETTDHPYWELEKRCGDLYGLFCTEGPEPPGSEENRRIFYQRAPEE